MTTPQPEKTGATPSDPTDMNAWMRGTTVADQDPVLDTIAYVWSAVLKVNLTKDQVVTALSIADRLR